MINHLSQSEISIVSGGGIALDAIASGVSVGILVATGVPMAAIGILSGGAFITGMAGAIASYATYGNVGKAEDAFMEKATFVYAFAALYMTAYKLSGTEFQTNIISLTKKKA